MYSCISLYLSIYRSIYIYIYIYTQNVLYMVPNVMDLIHWPQASSQTRAKVYLSSQT